MSRLENKFRQISLEGNSARISSPRARMFREQPRQNIAMATSSKAKNSALQSNSSEQPQLPAIPQSQEVKKFIKEPSYSTILQPELQLHYQAASTIGLRPSSVQPCNVQLDQPVYANVAGYEGEDLPQYYASPPSPVSSSYSELRQATKYPPGYHFQQMAAAGPTYDSLYEPIQQPKKSLYGSEVYKAGGSNSSSSSSSGDHFGLCSKCREKIVGEGTGCEAMGRRYHVDCFTCHQCQCRLQGKPFYALDGKPFCSEDYLNTLEKCCKCLAPIRDRILRATGKPYHPLCFTCLVCGHSLDGVPFTVDSTNQIHCIPCFHRRFAPKCSVCHGPIMPQNGQEETVRVVALDRSFHVNCYRCEDCSLLLSSEEEGGSGCYPLDDHVLCKNCNTARIQALTYGIK